MELVILGLLGLIVLVLVLVWLQTNSRINSLTERLLDSDRRIQEATTQSFGQIQQNLGELARTSRYMEEVGKEISGLSDLLRAPKLRGGIGELFLGDLLSQILSPEQYKLQHTFRSGERVDAVIILKAGMVPVDSKFPLESFQRMMIVEDEEERKRHRREFVRSVKGHIDDIARKYILPDEGTFNFALMYIPAESVYYETIIRDEALGEEKSLLNYALEKRVIPVSPNSFYAYLQAIALGLSGLQIEKRAQEIMRYLARLQGDFERFKEDYETLGGHIERARKKYDEAEKKLGRFEDKLLSASEPTAPELPPAKVDQPEGEQEP
ncbi:MAG: DNA recombination protein RmuC [Anaerolineae bacterium]